MRSKMPTILRLDAFANAAGGLVLLAAGGWLAPHVGLATSWPIRIVGALLVAYGIENVLVARRPSARAIAGLIAVDIGFAAAVAAFVLIDPTTASVWVRALLAVAAVASLTFGAAKYAGRAWSHESAAPHTAGTHRRSEEAAR